MNFLIIADRYYPVPLANSICVKSLVDEFERTGHQCMIINRMDNGVKVEESKGIQSFCCSKSPSYRLPMKSLYKIGHMFVYPHIYKRLVNAYYDQIMKVNLSKVDVIISVCNPIESVLAALKIREQYPNIRQVVYNVDTLSDFRIRQIENICCPFWHQLAYKVEKRIFDHADLTVFLSSHKGFYTERKYAAYSQRFLFQEVPLLKVVDIGELMDNGHCLYAGRFYKDFREPSILLNLFKNTRLPLDIYTTKNFCNSIRRSSNSSDNISVNEYIPEEELNEIMKQSKILVSIGNKSSNMFPSKTVSYVAMCKPIIHIFHDDMDPVVNYLRDYPDVLFVDLRNSLAKNRALVAEYCGREHPQINVKEIEKLYKTSTTQYCAREIMEKINIL